MREEAKKDSLTQLCTRATVLELLKQELDRSQRSVDRDTPVSVVLANLDHFKHINDTYGHLAGDGVLRETARRMRDAVRPYDSIGRYSGEEFLLVLPNCDTIGAVALAERLLQAVRNDTIVLDEGTVSVTLSAGVATSGIVQDAKTLVGAADAALSRAKRGECNRVEVATAVDLKAG